MWDLLPRMPSYLHYVHSLHSADLLAFPVFPLVVENLHDTGKKLLSVMSHFLTVLYPPPTTFPHRTLTSPPPRKQREKILAITQEEWEDPTPTSPPSAARNPTPISAPPPPKTQKRWALPVTYDGWDEAEDAVAEDITIRQKTPKTSVPSPRPSPRPANQQTSGTWPQKWKEAEEPTPPALDSQAQPYKKRRINRESTTETEGTHKPKTKEENQSSLTIVPVEESLNLGKIEHGQTTQIFEDEVLGYKDLPIKAYELSVLLRLGRTFELVDFLARAQVVAVARMAEEHAESKMAQRALLGELEPKDDRAVCI